MNRTYCINLWGSKKWGGGGNKLAKWWHRHVARQTGPKHIGCLETKINNIFKIVWWFRVPLPQKPLKSTCHRAKWHPVQSITAGSWSFAESRSYRDSSKCFSIPLTHTLWCPVRHPVATSVLVDPYHVLCKLKNFECFSFLLLLLHGPREDLRFVRCT